MKMAEGNANADCCDKSDRVECGGKRKLPAAADTKTTKFKASQSENICNDSENVAATKCLADLNDDCLEEIYKYLNFREQFHLARLCIRMRDFFICFNNFHKTDLNLCDLKDMELCEVHDFFRLLGPYITRIFGEGADARHVSIIAQHCKNITHFCLVSFEYKLSSFIGFNDITQYMKELSKHLVDDNINIELRKFQGLKILDLFGNKYLTGAHIKTLSKTIEKLSLAHCKRLAVENIIDFCETLINLKLLNLIDCFDDFPQLDLRVPCEKLEVLKLSGVKSNIVPFAKFPKLKQLVIENSSLSNVLLELIKHKADQLEILTIRNCKIDISIAEMISKLHALRQIKCLFDNDDDLDDRALRYFCNLTNLEEITLAFSNNINNDALMHLVIGCKKLKRIHLRGIYSITEALFFNLIKEFRAQIQSKTFERQEPIIFELAETRISEAILNDSEYKAANDIIRINVEYYSFL